MGCVTKQLAYLNITVGLTNPTGLGLEKLEKTVCEIHYLENQDFHCNCFSFIVQESSETLTAHKFKM